MIVLRTTNSRHSIGWVRWLLLGLIAGIVATAAGCSSSSGDREAVSAAPIASGQESLFRFESLTDWVSYADAVAIVNVASDDVLPLEEPDQTERLVGRSVTVEFEDVLWGNGPPGGEATIIGQGWFENVDEGIRRPFVPTEGPRYEVGQRYVVAFVEWPYESEAGELARWSAMTDGSVIPLVGGVMSPVPGAPAAAKALAGLTPEELRVRLADTAPDPLAEKYADLNAFERYDKVWLERNGEPEHGEGP